MSCKNKVILQTDNRHADEPNSAEQGQEIIGGGELVAQQARGKNGSRIWRSELEGTEVRRVKVVECDPVPLKYLRKIAEHVQIRTMKINWQELGCKTDVVEPGSMMHDRAKKGGAMAPLKVCCRVFWCSTTSGISLKSHQSCLPGAHCTASPDCTARP